MQHPHIAYPKCFLCSKYGALVLKPALCNWAHSITNALCHKTSALAHFAHFYPCALAVAASRSCRCRIALLPSPHRALQLALAFGFACKALAGSIPSGSSSLGKQVSSTTLFTLHVGASSQAPHHCTLVALAPFTPWCASAVWKRRHVRWRAHLGTYKPQVSSNAASFALPPPRWCLLCCDRPRPSPPL